jgi:hypothetical protein
MTPDDAYWEALAARSELPMHQAARQCASCELNGDFRMEGQTTGRVLWACRAHQDDVFEELTGLGWRGQPVEILHVLRAGVIG